VTGNVQLRIDRCVCQRTLFADLLPLARAASWNLEAVLRETGCGDQCGLCLPYLRRMLRDGTTVFHSVLTLQDEETA
jgi:bacterioferritin-associated ferredoxin